MRTKYSIYNSISSLISSSTTMLLGFIAQAIFIRILGYEYLGLNGLFTNVITMLSFFELGMGNAIVYNLYKPIADNDEKKIKALMNFYKKAYNIIALLVFGVGIIILPFIKIFVGEVTVDVNLFLVYFLFLLSTVSTYLVAYKRSLLYANQKNYIINIIHTVYTFTVNIAQLVILYFTKNYYLYLGTKIVCQLIENVIISLNANKLYPMLKETNNEKLDKKTEKNIFNKVKGLLFHKVGSALVNGTDNIIISKFLGVYTVGLYANYELITRACNTMFGQMLTSTTASVGNLLASSDKSKAFNVFKKMRFLNFWISCFTATCILVIVQPFVKVWIGGEGLLPLTVLVFIVFNYFQKLQRNTYFAFKDSAGIWVEDKYVPLVESVINITVSIIGVKLIGLAGVFIGTIVSGLSYWCYSYPKYVYKRLFDRNYSNYYKETFGYIGLFFIIASLTFYVSTLIVVKGALLQVIVNTILCLVLPNILICLLFFKTEEFKYIISIFNKILGKFKFKKRIN